MTPFWNLFLINLYLLLILSLGEGIGSERGRLERGNQAQFELLVRQSPRDEAPGSEEDCGKTHFPCILKFLLDRGMGVPLQGDGRVHLKADRWANKNGTNICCFYLYIS